MTKAKQETIQIATHLKTGDTVMIISGGNKKKNQLKGKTGKILRFVGKDRSRAVIEGLNIVTRHRRAAGPDKPAGKIKREAAVHVSKLMYYAEKAKKPVRLRHNRLADGTKVRGYLDPKSKEFVQI